MSELCLSTTPDTSKFHNLLLNDLYFFSSFILSHPLYFSYFIFFSPYLLKLLSFLSPLFLTTSLLLLALHLTFSPAFQFNDPGFLLSTFLTITETLGSKTDDEDPYNFEEFEVYKIVFDHTCRFDVREIPNEASEGNCVTKFCTHEEQVSGVTVTKAEERKLESFLELLDKFENMGKGKGNVEEKKVDEAASASASACPKSNKVVVGELQKEDLVSGSEATGREYSSSKVTSNYKISGNNVNKDENLDSRRRSFDSSRSDLGSYGSMRKEKEWKRTLACKLYEERQNVGGEEGMDSLWETYDTDSSKLIAKNKSDDDRNSKKKKNRKKSGISTEYYYDLENEDDQELPNGQFCCLHALKLSSGKMNFGMGKPNLVKISKALKGIGWLHHHVIRQGKKDRY